MFFIKRMQDTLLVYHCCLGLFMIDNLEKLENEII